MLIFSTIKIDGKKHYLTDEQARYFLKETVYAGGKSLYLSFYNPYEDINGNEYPRFDKVGEDSYVESDTGRYLYNAKTESYFDPYEGKDRYSREFQFRKNDNGIYIYNPVTNKFYDPYAGVTRYKPKGNIESELDPNGQYCYDPLLSVNGGFYLPYYDKYNQSVALPRFLKYTDPDGTVSYIPYEKGDCIYDKETNRYYNPLYNINHQPIKNPDGSSDPGWLLDKYRIWISEGYEEDPEGIYIYDEVNDRYYNPYDGVQKYSPSDELSSFYPDVDGLYIGTDNFDINSIPGYGFYAEFPEWVPEKTQFYLGNEQIFERPNGDTAVYIDKVDVEDGALEEGAIDKINGQSIADDRKARVNEYIELTGGYTYSITNGNEYWMQIFEYKFDLVLNDYVFIRSYKLPYGNLFTIHEMATHIRFASGDADTTDLFNVRIRCVRDPEVSSYVYTGPYFESFDEAYKAGYYYYFDSNDRTQFCKLIGNGETCQAYERYQISTEVLKIVTQVEDEVNNALSEITQTGASIEIIVQNKMGDVITTINQTVNELMLEVEDKQNDLHTQIQLTADALTNVASSNFEVLDTKRLNSEQLQYFEENPIAFSSTYPLYIDDDNFELDPEHTIMAGYITAYGQGHYYFNPRIDYFPSENGRYVLNGDYYDPYAAEIASGNHRYTRVTSEDGSESYEIDDTNGVYILSGATYYDPYEVYPRYDKYAVFNLLKYNVDTGYSYDVCTFSNTRLSSVIEQTGSQITHEVSKERGIIYSRIKQTADKIELQVEDLNESLTTKIIQTASDITATASSGGYEYVGAPSESFASGAANFYSRRPVFENNNYVFDPDSSKSYESYQEACDDEHYYFPLTGANKYYYDVCANGEYILVNSNYVNPYENAQRYYKVQDVDLNTISYKSNPNGRYIRNSSGEYVDPYEGKTRYTRYPCYCEIVKAGEEYFINRVTSVKYKNEALLNLASEQIKLNVSDNAGTSTSLVQTARSIRTNVDDYNTKQRTRLTQDESKISANAESMVSVAFGPSTNIPSDFIGRARYYWSISPKYDDGEIVFDNDYRKTFNSYIDAYGGAEPANATVPTVRYQYTTAPDVAVEDTFGNMILKNGSYVNPYANATRYTKYSKASQTEHYEEDINGDYVETGDGEYALLSELDNFNFGVVTKYSKVVSYITEDDYVEDANGIYIESDLGEKYNPYDGVKRYSIYPSFYKIEKQSNGTFVISQLVFNQHKVSSTFEQTAERLRSIIANENSDRQSEISQTENEILARIANANDKIEARIRLTQDSVTSIIKTSVTYILDTLTTVENFGVPGIFKAEPAYDKDLGAFDFSDPEYITKYKYPNSNIPAAYADGYYYIPYINSVYVEDPMGDFIYNTARGYYNPYNGVDRYSKVYVDKDAEGSMRDYTYEIDSNGKFIFIDGEPVDPYDGQTRYIRLPAELNKYSTYIKIVGIQSTPVAYHYNIPDASQGPIAIEVNANIYVKFGDNIYKFNNIVPIYNNYTLRYDIATNRITVGVGSTIEQTVISENFEIVDEADEYNDGYYFKEFETEYSYIYTYDIIGCVPKLRESQIEQTINQIKLLVSDINGQQSQITQTAGNITSLVSGAPSPIQSISDAESILSSITEFYNSMPIYGEDGKFHFDSQSPFIGAYTQAFRENYRFFAKPDPIYLEDEEGLYIRSLIIKDPVYEYINPKNELDIFGNPYTKWSDDYYSEDTTGDPDYGISLYFKAYTFVNPLDDDTLTGPYIKNGDIYTATTDLSNPSNLWMKNANNEYYNPWYGTAKFSKSRFGKFVDYNTKELFIGDNNGLYLRVEVKDSNGNNVYYSPWLDDGAVRYSLSPYDHEVEGITLYKDYNTGKYYEVNSSNGMYIRREVALPDEYAYNIPYEDLEGNPITRYSKGYRNVEQNQSTLYIDPYNINSVKDLSDGTETFYKYGYEAASIKTNENYILNNGEYSCPYYDEDGAKLETFSPVEGATNEDGSQYYMYDPDGLFINNNGTYSNPLASTNGYTRSLVEDAFVDDDEHYIILNGMEYNLSDIPRVKIGYTEDPMGAYIKRGDEYIIPKIGNTRYSKYYVFGKFFCTNNEYSITYYNRIDDNVNTKIDQTAEKIALSTSDMDEKLTSSLEVGSTAITALINNKENQTSAIIAATANRIFNQVKANEANMRTDFAVMADSIRSVVTGSYYLVSSGNTASGFELTLYEEIPYRDNSNDTFVNKGKYRNTSTKQNVIDAIDGGFVYDANNRVTYIKTSATEGEYAYVVTAGVGSYEQVPVNQRYDRTISGCSYDTTDTLHETPIYTYEYEQSDTGEYRKVGSNYDLVNWHKQVSAYRHYYVSDNDIKYDEYASDSDNYTSLIAQTPNSISAVVENGKLNASLLMQLINDESVVDLTANRINLNGYVFIKSGASKQINFMDGELFNSSATSTNVGETWRISADGTIRLTNGDNTIALSTSSSDAYFIEAGTTNGAQFTLNKNGVFSIDSNGATGGYLKLSSTANNTTNFIEAGTKPPAGAPSTAQPDVKFRVDKDGNVYVSGSIHMGAGSVIDWNETSTSGSSPYMGSGYTPSYSEVCKALEDISSSDKNIFTTLDSSSVYTLNVKAANIYGSNIYSGIPTAENHETVLHMGSDSFQIFQTYGGIEHEKMKLGISDVGQYGTIFLKLGAGADSDGNNIMYVTKTDSVGYINYNYMGSDNIFNAMSIEFSDDMYIRASHGITMDTTRNGSTSTVNIIGELRINGEPVRAYFG